MTAKIDSIIHFALFKRPFLFCRKKETRYYRALLFITACIFKQNDRRQPGNWRLL